MAPQYHQLFVLAHHLKPSTIRVYPTFTVSSSTALPLLGKENQFQPPPTPNTQPSIKLLSRIQILPICQSPTQHTISESFRVPPSTFLCSPSPPTGNRTPALEQNAGFHSSSLTASCVTSLQCPHLQMEIVTVPYS